MEIDEAIKHCEEVAEEKQKSCVECARDHLQLAEWLKELKAIKEDGDCISRQAVIEAIEDDKRKGNDSCYASNYDAQCFKQIIKELPPVKPEQKMGRWIEKDGFDGDTYYDCSECGESFCLIDGTPTDNLYNYCPNCGAKMEGE